MLKASSANSLYACGWGGNNKAFDNWFHTGGIPGTASMPSQTMGERGMINW